jgi:hypothetical protein
VPNGYQKTGDCPICKTGQATFIDNLPFLANIDCRRCGRFMVELILLNVLPEWFSRDASRAPVMSHTIGRMQREGREPPLVTRENIRTYCETPLPTPPEQVDDLILWIGDNQPDGATNARAPELLLDAWIGARLPDVPGNAKGLRWLVAAAEPEMASNPHHFVCQYDRENASLRLTIEGWKRYASLKQTRTDSRTAFMAMKFDKPDVTEAIEKCFRPAVERAGFELRAVTDQPRAGLIDDHMRAAIIAARFVIADLTYGSFGAYWEAGFGDGRGLPVIYTCSKDQWNDTRPHFDVNHMRHVLWDLKDLKPAENELVSIIRTELRADAKQTDD